ncbi:MAG: hypothetical protein J0H09_29770 [Burkholderiales bacterium]|nr:hypothetical protein [Burkholderiales bacterium]
MSLSPLIEFDSECVNLLNGAPRTHSVHCFRSALYHLERSEALRDVDPAMAGFRAITSEEEAASGLIRCLQELGYARSKELNPHDHVHKHALYPFLEIIGSFFSETLGRIFTSFELRIEEVEGKQRLRLATEMQTEAGPLRAYPIPPLGFTVRDGVTKQPIDYAIQIDGFIKANGASSIREFLKGEANFRNRLLYANPNGYPTVERLGESFILIRRQRVMVMLKAFLLLYPYSEHQLYASQAVASLADLLSQIKRPRLTKPGAVFSEEGKP